MAYVGEKEWKYKLYEFQWCYVLIDTLFFKNDTHDPEKLSYTLDVGGNLETYHDPVSQNSQICPTIISLLTIGSSCPVSQNLKHTQ